MISQVDADQMSSSKDVWTRSRREVKAGYVLAPIPQEQETEDMSWNALRAEAKMIGRMLEEGTKVSSEQISNLVKQMTAKEKEERATQANLKDLYKQQKQEMKTLNERVLRSDTPTAEDMAKFQENDHLTKFSDVVFF